jgi:AbrB family looped-hinge helix DNA binding protein
MTFSTTKLSSKGQVVIPESVRDELQIKEGAHFMVIGQGDTVILKIIAPPRPAEFKALLAESHAQAKAAGLKKSDIKKAIKKVRSRS